MNPADPIRAEIVDGLLEPAQAERGAPATASSTCRRPYDETPYARVLGYAAAGARELAARLGSVVHAGRTLSHALRVFADALAPPRPTR